jgi:DNA-binding transcriptional LysR family regulator
LLTSLEDWRDVPAAHNRKLKTVVYDAVRLSDNWTFRRDGKEESVAVRGRLRLSAAEGIRAAVLADMGLAVASDWMFGPELANGAVERMLPEWTLPPIDLWAVYPTGRLATAKARAFADFIETVLSDS